MNYEEFDHLMGGLSSAATIAALIVGGIWTYRRFIRTREACPKIEFTVDVGFVQRQNGFWIVEVLAYLENKGLVKHSIKRFTFDLRYTLPTDPIQRKDDFLVYIPHDGADGSWLPQGWDSTFIEPGLRTRYSSLASIPEAATSVLIHGKFFYEDDDWHTADRLLAVPQCVAAERGEQSHALDPTTGTVSIRKPSPPSQ